MHMWFHAKSGLRRIWSRTHLIPGLPVPDFLSPWTNGPQQIWSPWKNGPPKFGPPGQMVPNQFGPCISGSLQPVPLDKQNILGTICLGGPNWLWTIAFVHGDQIVWGLFVQMDQSIGDPLWGTKCPGTICVWDQMFNVSQPIIGEDC